MGKRGRGERTTLTGYRILWIQVLFDLPVTTKKTRKAATDFRNHLLDLGFEMSQYSVYQRCCSGKEMAETLMGKIQKRLPEEGKVHVLTFTDKQYADIRTFRGKKRGSKQKNPDQYTLF